MISGGLGVDGGHGGGNRKFTIDNPPNAQRGVGGGTAVRGRTYFKILISRADKIKYPVSSHTTLLPSLLVLESLASLFWSRERTVRFLYVLPYIYCNILVRGTFLAFLVIAYLPRSTVIFLIA